MFGCSYISLNSLESYELLNGTYPESARDSIFFYEASLLGRSGIVASMSYILILSVPNPIQISNMLAM